MGTPGLEKRWLQGMVGGRISYQKLSENMCNRTKGKFWYRNMDKNAAKKKEKLTYWCLLWKAWK